PSGGARDDRCPAGGTRREAEPPAASIRSRNRHRAPPSLRTAGSPEPTERQRSSIPIRSRPPGYLEKRALQEIGWAEGGHPLCSGPGGSKPCAMSNCIEPCWG